MTNTDKAFDEILQELQTQIIENVKHGIYINLPTPKAKTALKALLNSEVEKAVVAELERWNVGVMISPNAIQKRLKQLNQGEKNSETTK